MSYVSFESSAWKVASATFLIYLHSALFINIQHKRCVKKINYILYLNLNFKYILNHKLLVLLVSSICFTISKEYILGNSKVGFFFAYKTIFESIL